MSAESDAGQDPTYYDRPLLKEPTWIWAVPAYFWVGGAAGAAATLGAAAQLMDRAGLDGLVRRCRWLSAAGGAIGTVLLIVDLGRPSRFLNMLRVFRPSSPMNVGSWVLATVGPSAAGAAVAGEVPWWPARLFADLSGVVAGLSGLPLAGYTGVLLANTAIPVWQGSRRALPPLFVGSGMLAGAGTLQLLGLSTRERNVVRRFAVAGALMDLGAEVAYDREVGRVERVADATEQGVAGSLLRAAKALTGAALIANLLPSRFGRWRDRLAAVLGIGASLATKFGVFFAGKRSAADPRATFHQQRQGLGAAEITGRAAVDGPGSRAP